MTAPRSLEYFGTIAFDGAFMRELIFLGWFDVRDGVVTRHPSGDLELGLWMQFVPASFRHAVEQLVREIAPDYLRRKADARLLDVFIGRLQSEIFDRVAPVLPGEAATVGPRVGR